MIDDADRASEIEAREREAILGRRRFRRTPQGAAAADGERLCCDCSGVIPPRRVTALPDVMRCVRCQQIQEVGHARL